MSSAKTKINLVGGDFKHCLSTNGYILPKKIEWVLDGTANISIHIDNAIFTSTDKTKRNFGFIVESKTIEPYVYANVDRNISFLEEQYEYIFTHDISLTKKSDKFKLITPPCTSWIPEEERKIYKKNKLVSMIASNKNRCAEHVFRNSIAKQLENSVDLFGRGRSREIQNKIEALKDYCFSISMENGIYEDMYTEKLLDCFTTGAIPIYYGSRCIEKYFNPEGVIWIDEFDIQNLTYELYKYKLDAVKENFEIAKNLPLPEDYIYENFIKE